LRDIADSLDEGARIDAIIIDISKDFDLVPYDWLLTKIAVSCVDSMVVVWVRDFLLGLSQRLAAATGKRGWKQRQDSSVGSSGWQQRLPGMYGVSGSKHRLAAVVLAAAGSRAGRSGWPQRLPTTGNSNG